jgi:hypothetical protein
MDLCALLRTQFRGLTSWGREWAGLRHLRIFSEPFQRFHPLLAEQNVAAPAADPQRTTFVALLHERSA